MGKVGKKFEYNGISSEKFHVLLVSFDSVDNIEMGLARSITTSDITQFNSRPNHMGALYDEALMFDITLVKDPNYYGAQSNLAFSRTEIRELNAWLTSPMYPCLLHITDCEENEEYIDYFCMFNSVDTNFFDYLYGLTYTAQCDSPFGYSREYTHKLSCAYTNKSESIKITCSSDERELRLPVSVVIKPTQTGQVTISNETQGQSLIIQCLRDNIIYLNSQKLKAKCILTDDINFDDSTLLSDEKLDKLGSLISLEDLGLKDIGDLYWLTLSYGENTISLTGCADISIIYREPRKVGAY